MNLTASKDMTPPGRRYVRDTVVAMTLYVALNAAAIAGVIDDAPPPARWAFAVVVASTIAFQIRATLFFMRDSDEFVRGVTARRFIIAAGVAFAVATAWGFAESYAGAPHIPAWMIYPLFWAAFGLVTPFVRTTT